MIGRKATRGFLEHADENAPSGDGAIVVPFPLVRELIVPATEYFAGGVTTSQDLLREHGYYDDYVCQLPEKLAARILEIRPNGWIPMALAVEHYLACDRLDLDRQVIIDLGEKAAMKLYSPAFLLAVRFAVSAGATPWTVIRKLTVTVTKSMRGGGGVCARKLGPKEVRIEFEGHPLAASTHFRTAFGASLRHPVSLFCRKAVLREVLIPDRPHAMAYLMSWV